MNFLFLFPPFSWRPPHFGLLPLLWPARSLSCDSKSNFTSCCKTGAVGKLAGPGGVMTGSPGLWGPSERIGRCGHLCTSPPGSRCLLAFRGAWYQWREPPNASRDLAYRESPTNIFASQEMSRDKRWEGVGEWGCYDALQRAMQANAEHFVGDQCNQCQRS